MWSRNLVALTAGRRVVTWDVRGHGHSASPHEPSEYSEAACVDDMAAVLDACGITRAVIGGLSLGGYLSLAFHLANPDRVAALLLFDTGPGYGNDKARQRWNTWARAMAESFATAGVAALPEGTEVDFGPHDPIGLQRAAAGILTQNDSRVIESLPTIAVPTLVLVGGEDRPFLGAADYMASRIPGATKVVMERCGHTPNIEDPLTFNETVTAFLTAHT